MRMQIVSEKYGDLFVRGWCFRKHVNASAKARHNHEGKGKNPFQAHKNNPFDVPYFVYRLNSTINTAKCQVVFRSEKTKRSSAI